MNERQVLGLMALTPWYVPPSTLHCPLQQNAWEGPAHARQLCVIQEKEPLKGYDFLVLHGLSRNPRSSDPVVQPPKHSMPNPLNPELQTLNPTALYPKALTISPNKPYTVSPPKGKVAASEARCSASEAEPGAARN